MEAKEYLLMRMVFTMRWKEMMCLLSDKNVHEKQRFQEIMMNYTKC